MTTSCPRTGRSDVRAPLAALLAFVCLTAACRSVQRGSDPDRWQAGWFDEAVQTLSRPLPDAMAALYRMRVPSTGGLRLAVVARPGVGGRMTVSEPFGAAVLVAGWDGAGEATVFDLDAGCRLKRWQARAEVGFGDLPLDRVVRLLGGRLPALSSDQFLPAGDGEIDITTATWTARAVVAPDPWRVVAVSTSGLTVELERHTSSLPGRLRVIGDDREPLDVVLVSLKWEAPEDLPPLPDLPECGD